MFPKSGAIQSLCRTVEIILSAVLFFFAVCLSAGTTKKGMAVLLILLALCAIFLFYDQIRDRVGLPVVAMGLITLMDGISCFYAASGKFALQEFLTVLSAFCLTLLLLGLSSGREPGRWTASVVAGCCAIAGLVSIDLISTRWISTPVLAILEQFTTSYSDFPVVEDGVRMLSVFQAPNPFAGCMGIGVLLSLGLANTAKSRYMRAAHLICLAVNSLAFVLVFSMGACAAILPAFLVLLLLAEKEQRIGLLFLMVETLAVTLLASFPVSLTSMTAWEGVRPIPLLCTAASAAALCGLELLLGRRLSEKLRGRGKLVAGLAAALLAVLVAFAVAACNLTGSITLRPGEALRRSAYPKPGAYTLAAEAGADITVSVESQNRLDIMMHTVTELYQGPLSQAAFMVPEDSLITWFTFSAESEQRLDQVRYTGENDSGSVPLNYLLLPGFISNRLQGLLVNQNAIQRLAFFEDGLKLFRRSPVIGLGMGAFSNAARSVQTFSYATKYVHNHYIQALVDTGIIGLILFLFLLAVSAAAVWCARKTCPLAPALGAALAFMAGHAIVEVDFSFYAFLPFAFGAFATISLCCGPSLPVPKWIPEWMKKEEMRSGFLLVGGACMMVFGILLNCNIIADKLARQTSELSDLEQAMKLDRFEWADHMLSYVLWTSSPEVDAATRQKADEYAVRLAELNSNTIPLYLAEYYFETGRVERGLTMVEQYVNYVSSSTASWQKAFDLLERYESDTDVYRAGVARIVALLNTWNDENIGHIALNEQAQAFMDRMLF